MSSTATAPTAADDRARRFHTALGDLIRVYQFRDRNRVCEFGISVSQCYALEAIVQRGPLGVNDLTVHLYSDKSTVSRVVDGLVRKNLVRRDPNSDNRRAVRIQATAQGRALYRRITDQLLQREQTLLARFPAQTQEHAAELLEQLAQAAAARVCVDRGSCSERDPD